MSYSVDLREKVLEYIAKQGGMKEASVIFGISQRTLYNWSQKLKQGSLEDAVPSRPWKKIDPELLLKEVESNSGFLLKDFALKFKVRGASMFAAFKRLKITSKKRAFYIKNVMRREERYFWSISGRKIGIT